MTDMFIKGMGLLAMVALVVLLELFVIKCGWSMFMVPIFGLKELTWEQAAGAMLLSSLFKAAPNPFKKKET